MTEFLQGTHWSEFVNHFATIWVISTLIHHMPPPLENDRWYKWIYNSLQAFMANWGTLRAGKVPLSYDRPKD